MSSYSDIKATDIYKFISRWALFGGLAELALLVMMMAFVMPASQGSGLSDDFMELVAAGRIPGVYRLAIILDASVWLAIGGLLVAFGILFFRTHPLKSVWIAAGGLAQVTGFTGAFLRLEGTGGLAGNYLSAAPDQQARILRSYLDLQTAFNAHFDAGSLIYALSFLLVSIVIWKTNTFPRWYGFLLALVGTLNLANDVINLASGGYQFMLFFLALLAEIATFISTSVVFWQRKQKDWEMQREVA